MDTNYSPYSHYGPATHAFLAMGVADAVGADFEFGNPDKREVVRCITGITGLRITDDTQMALFGLEGMTNALLQSRSYEPQVVQAYVRWWDSQKLHMSDSHTGLPLGGLAAEPLMRVRRAPGNTCMSSLKSIASAQHVKNDSSGCGTVMRLLPFAVAEAYGVDSNEMTDLAVATSLATHKGDQVFPSTKQYMEYARSLAYTRNLYTLPYLTGKDITSQGEGWCAQECLDMAVWALNRAKSYEDLLMLTICHPGDSDSVAAVAGSLWGMAGFPVPHRLVARLVERHLILTTVASYESALKQSAS